MSEFFGFENFRSTEKEVLIDLEKITILTGPNSSGKSSVIKAAKLLKQNINSEEYSGFPEDLSFLPDELGHNLGSFEQIVNRSSLSHDVSFIIPFKLATLGEGFYGKLIYGPLEDGPRKGTVTLKSFSIFKKDEVAQLLVSLKGGLGQFLEMELNPLLIKSCIEDAYIPFVKNTKTIDLPDGSVYTYNIRDYIPGKKLLASYMLFAAEIYSPKEPIMPWFTLFKDNSTKRTQFISESPAVYHFFEKEIKEFKKTNNIKDYTEALYKYFILQEYNFFRFINDTNLHFGIDSGIDGDSLGWWEGIRLDYRIDDDIRTPDETIVAVNIYDEMLFKLMNCYESIPDEDDQALLNHDIFREYLQYIVVESIESCRKFVNEFRFADLNRIEQVMLYSNISSQTAFKIINDFSKCEYQGFQNKEVSTFLRELKIADEFKIERGNGFYTISLLKGNDWVPLSELGYGISKIFFCLLALRTYDVVFLEEPESNLHPDFQAKLADIIQKFSTINKTIIIETHSEYLIRKLQYLVATNEIDKDDVIIHYFRSLSLKRQSTQINTIRIKRDGGLDGEFGPGFYDEAANIIRDLFSLTYYN